VPISQYDWVSKKLAEILFTNESLEKLAKPPLLLPFYSVLASDQRTVVVGKDLKCAPWRYGNTKAVTVYWVWCTTNRTSNPVCPDMVGLKFWKKCGTGDGTGHGQLGPSCPHSSCIHLHESTENNATPNLVAERKRERETHTHTTLTYSLGWAWVRLNWVFLKGWMDVTSCDRPGQANFIRWLDWMF